MSYAIRPAKREDFPALVRFWIATWQLSTPHLDIEAHGSYIMGELTRAIGDGRHVLVAAQADGTPCGFAILNTKSREIEHIAAAREHLGHGLARLMMQAAKEVCPDELFLTVNKDNPRAIWFYAREGFEVVGEEMNLRLRLPVLRLRWQRED